MSIEVTREDRDAAGHLYDALTEWFGDSPRVLSRDMIAEHFAAYRTRIEAAATAKFRVKANEAANLARDARDQGRQIAQAALNAEADAWNEAAELLREVS